MPCYSPLKGALVGPPGARSLVFKGSVGKGVSLPCGRCIGCRLERSRQWAVRIMHEASMHECSSFITLTYSPEFLPIDGSLSVSSCQSFLKRLRSRLAPLRVRFFLCGEYGERFGRPHYHAIIFGYDFPDKVRLDKPGDFALYSSAFLSAVWGFGRCSVGSVQFESASYVANYATKKIIGAGADAHYGGRKPEFLLMSRRPGIGRSWIDKFGFEVLRDDEVITRGVSARPPRYYDQVLQASFPDEFGVIRALREVAADKLEAFKLRSGEVVGVSPGRNAVRLAVRERVAQAKLSLKSRSLESLR